MAFLRIFFFLNLWKITTAWPWHERELTVYHVCFHSLLIELDHSSLHFSCSSVSCSELSGLFSWLILSHAASCLSSHHSVFESSSAWCLSLINFRCFQFPSSRTNDTIAHARIVPQATVPFLLLLSFPLHPPSIWIAPRQSFVVF